MRHYTETINLLENSSFYYTIAIGMDSNYSYVSPNYDRNFSYLGGSLLGRSYDISLHPDDRNICAAVAAQCFENPGQLFAATLRKHDGRGGFVFTHWEFKALLDEQGRPEGIICIGYNISEQVITRNQLQLQTDKLADIGYMQAHFIRKPLANIIGLIGILDMMTIDANLVNIKNMIMDSARELDAVIKKIITKAG